MVKKKELTIEEKLEQENIKFLLKCIFEIFIILIMIKNKEIN